MVTDSVMPDLVVLPWLLILFDVCSGEGSRSIGDL